MAFDDFFLTVSNCDVRVLFVHCVACEIMMRPSAWRDHVRGTKHSLKLERLPRLQLAGVVEMTDEQWRLQESYNARKKRRLRRALRKSRIESRIDLVLLGVEEGPRCQ